ncbi:acyl-CoA dehydrogenase family protein [Enterovirga rhinocerotis]|uniref:Acyl-CoA dehydrogenase n=1 Tax=Enterovirga rhinocerotis TaxID=1339210 RepID=A0A4R7BW03_9HYPH|nr:acyl-CoA dehydrogenase family protein [Enterovirga rhinocerotis]TDR89282.1 acyl-CoA dehydrogenase [Enterovirga rhinocerotis]
MSESDEIVLDSTRRLFDDLFPRDEASRRDETAWPAQAWASVEELGLPLALLSEDQGGFGLSAETLAGIMALAGEAALPLPLAETMIATRLLGVSGIEAPQGPLSIAPAPSGGRIQATREGAGLRLSGVLPRVPWGAQAAGIVLVADTAEGPCLALLRPADYRVSAGKNLAGEPRDDVALDGAIDGAFVRPGDCAARDLKALGAAFRAMAMAGSIGRVLAMSVAYANERVQFGRPIGKFQAIQQNLAIVAGQAAASAGAAAIAAEAVSGRGGRLAMAAAKLRTGEAAGIVASIAHQVHGAIGCTHEHSLHIHTRRLWSWRDEFGNEAEWSRELGEHVVGLGADGLWPFVTSL